MPKYGWRSLPAGPETDTGTEVASFDRSTYPTGIAVASDGSVYVTDPENDQIQKFTSEGVFVGQWGTTGEGDGQFSESRGVAVGPDGSIYVVDRLNYRIQKFSMAQ